MEAEMRTKGLKWQNYTFEEKATRFHFSIIAEDGTPVKLEQLLWRKGIDTYDWFRPCNKKFGFFSTAYRMSSNMINDALEDKYFVKIDKERKNNDYWNKQEWIRVDKEQQEQKEIEKENEKEVEKEVEKEKKKEEEEEQKKLNREKSEETSERKEQGQKEKAKDNMGKMQDEKYKEEERNDRENRKLTESLIKEEIIREEQRIVELEEELATLIEKRKKRRKEKI